MMKTNMYMLIVLPLLGLLIVGCSGRRGPFIELGVGMTPVIADEEWTARTYDAGFFSGPLLEQTHHDAIAATVFPAGNLKIGWGFTEQLLVSQSIQVSKLTTTGIGITVFQKKTAPSLFFDITLPVSFYFPNFSDEVSQFVDGYGASVSVGYEFKKNWTVQGDFSFGTHDFYVTDQDLGEGILLLFGVNTGYTAYEGETTGYSLGFKINYIWY